MINVAKAVKYLRAAGWQHSPSSRWWWSKCWDNSSWRKAVTSRLN